MECDFVRCEVCEGYMDSEAVSEIAKGTAEDPKIQATSLFCQECLCIERLGDIIARLNSASAEEKEAARKKLRKRYHPDVNRSNPHAVKQFQEIEQAFDKEPQVTYTRKSTKTDEEIEDFIRQYSPKPVDISGFEGMIPEHLREKIKNPGRKKQTKPKEEDDSLTKIFNDAVSEGLDGIRKAKASKSFKDMFGKL